MTNADLYVTKLAAKLGISLAAARAIVVAETAERCKGRYASDKAGKR